MNCPRCGRAQPPEATGPFCAHCGQFLVPSNWVALPPPRDPSGSKAEEPERRARYTGPPRYRETPRWGFPAMPWTSSAPSDDPTSAEVAAGYAALLVPMLRGLAVLAGVSGAAEIWRYVLLLRSRSGALGAGEVAASDALVTAASWVCTLMFVAVGVYLLMWLPKVVDAASANSGVRPPRSRRWMMIGWLVPGVNLSVPGSTFAEIEHAALGRSAGRRPRPSRLVLIWWGLWSVNVILGVITLIWSFRTGVQARADGVSMHAVLDLVAAATAVYTAKVVEWLTALVSPPKPMQLPRVISVRESVRTS